MSETPRRQARRLQVRRAAAWLAVAGAVWTIWLVLTGGLAIDVAGWTLRSRNPDRAAIITAAIVAVYLAAGGRARTLLGVWRGIERVWTRLPRAPRHPAPYLAVIAVGFLAVTAAYSSRAVGGSDSHGYASMAELLARFELTVEQPFALEAPWPNAPRTFSPLAYQPRTNDPGAIVPIVAPGYPLLLTAAKAVGGQDALVLVAPTAGVILILATFGLGRRLAGTTVGLAGAWLVATSPIVLGMSMAVMTDVPGAAAWVGAMYFLLGSGARSAALAGACSALAVLIRPNLAPLAAVLACRYLLREREVRVVDSIKQGLLFVAAFVPGPIAIALLNQYLFGSPLASGYGNPADLFDRARLVPNLWNYGGWLVDMHTPVVLAGVAALMLPFRWLWPHAGHRGVFAITAGFVIGLWAIYCAYDVFTTWWFLRYMTASIPLIVLGVAAIGAALMRSRVPVVPALSVAALVALGVVQVARASDGGVFTNWYHERRYIAAAQLTRQITGPRSVILTASHSGSVRYYGGRLTLRYHELPGPWLDRTVAWLGGQGVQVYALLDSWERHDFESYFAGADTLAGLVRPVAIYDTPGHLEIFNLSAPPAASAEPVRTTGVPLGWRAVGPVPMPRLRFEKR